ncbi:MAG: transglutaminase family protein [Verrucomicrobia bacterium]|nr:transglutaminase family protein [Verrucomicrobiota bacterium]
MLFNIVHTTGYVYADTAMEAYLEVRLTPPVRPEQGVLRHRIVFKPAAEASDYIDYFGNRTTFYSMTLRHRQLKVTNRLTVRTLPRVLPESGLALTIAEARQILKSRTGVFDYLQPTEAIPVDAESSAWARDILRENRPLREGLDELNKTIYREFKYRTGSTEIETPLSLIWKKREGVCQDFAHVMISVLRAARIPCRYVCGYIESEPSVSANPSLKRLVGSLATHAWVEVLVPGMAWVALDPTNNQWCGEQHVTVAVGRDFLDAAPVRGTFKGSASQKLKVHVSMQRIPEKL